MKNIYKLCGKTSLCFYLLFLYQAWYVCQYGGLRRHLLILLISLSGILLSSVLWMIARKLSIFDDLLADVAYSVGSL